MWCRTVWHLIANSSRNLHLHLHGITLMFHFL
jgi:hypothetical protein